jgi:Family of unknown function (DUF6152)
MKRLTAATPLLTAAAFASALLGAPASAHHSQSMFDTTKEIVIEGTVARFDWVNPHMYLVVCRRWSKAKASGSRKRSSTGSIATH